MRPAPRSASCVTERWSGAAPSASPTSSSSVPVDDRDQVQDRQRLQVAHVGRDRPPGSGRAARPGRAGAAVRARFPREALSRSPCVRSRGTSPASGTTPTGEFENREHYATVTEGLAHLRRGLAPVRAGNAVRATRATATMLLGAVIEGASGQPYLQYMHEAVVLAPAGMTHTSFGALRTASSPSRGRYYTRADSTGPHRECPLRGQHVQVAERRVSSRRRRTWRGSATGCCGASCCGPRPWRCSGPRCAPPDGKPTEYGIGWSVERDSTGRRRVRHSGGSVGGTAHLIIYPDDPARGRCAGEQRLHLHQRHPPIRGAISPSAALDEEEAPAATTPTGNGPKLSSSAASS